MGQSRGRKGNWLQECICSGEWTKPETVAKRQILAIENIKEVNVGLSRNLSQLFFRKPRDAVAAIFCHASYDVYIDACLESC